MLMKILVVPDKFKGTLSAAQAARAIAAGLRAGWPAEGPRPRIAQVPLSDGGEGFVEALARCAGGKLVFVRTVDPQGRPVRAAYAALPDGTAVVGLTEASGLWRVPPARRDPGTLTTVGTGRLIADALRRGFRRIVVGLGGSATNDGGIGLAAPLGFRFLDARGKEIPLTGEGLARLARIVPPRALPRAEIVAASDVTHPLYGPNGAAFQFAGQKGAGPEQVARLDANLRHLARVARASLGASPHRRAGAGAAGGCGYGLMAFLGARREAGFDLFAEASGLDALLAAHDLVVTGEGCFDATSLGGKGPAAVARRARRRGKPVWLVCGICRLSAAERRRTPFAAIGELAAAAPSAEAARKQAAKWARETARRLAAASQEAQSSKRSA